MKLPQLISREDALYRILEVEKSATFATIKRSYHDLARVYHPDKNAENENASAEKFNEIEYAYRILSDESMRKVYDCCGTRGLQIREQLGEEKFATLQKKWFQAVALLLGTLTGCFCCCCCFCCCGKLLRKSKNQANGKQCLEIEYPKAQEDLEEEGTEAPNEEPEPNEDDIRSSEDLQNAAGTSCQEGKQLGSDHSESERVQDIKIEEQKSERNDENSVIQNQKQETVPNIPLEKKYITVVIPKKNRVVVTESKNGSSVLKDVGTSAESTEKERQEMIANWWISHVEWIPKTASSTVGQGPNV